MQNSFLLDAFHAIFVLYVCSRRGNCFCCYCCCKCLYCIIQFKLILLFFFFCLSLSWQSVHPLCLTHTFMRVYVCMHIFMYFMHSLSHRLLSLTFFSTHYSNPSRLSHLPQRVLRQQQQQLRTPYLLLNLSCPFLISLWFGSAFSLLFVSFFCLFVIYICIWNVMSLPDHRLGLVWTSLSLILYKQFA